MAEIRKALTKELEAAFGVANSHPMNGYVCFYRGKKVEVHANSKFAAQQKAAMLLKAKRIYEVAVVLADKNGKVVEHHGGEL
jgi:hypothetical protein